MTIEEAIKLYTSNAEYERTHGCLQGCLNFRQLAGWLKDYKRLKEQEPKTGHWLYIDERKAKCSQCGYIQITGGVDKTGHCNIHYGVYKYCTNCGAKMIEQKESEET